MTHRNEIKEMIEEADRNLKRLEVIRPCFKKKEYALCTAMEYYYKSIVSAGNIWKEEIYG